ncbi:hypothetical protein [Candidatus Phycosocius bacilliformis]|uniref:hypothetical protein n=1 Tax=Candidatus Phycosocius bacilliformis TaxID=1445552 RepID=UPI001057CD7A|nr:hypothetical protein [Candidatus Phycosocius bacilliformis]
MAKWTTMLARKVQRDVGSGGRRLTSGKVGIGTCSTHSNTSLESGILAAIDTAASVRKLTRCTFMAQAARHEIVGR